jgi:ATP-binding cassette subfamily C (CFTR/MRP) protein 4
LLFPGRVLNRFSKDTGVIDDLLAPTYFDAFVIFLNVIGIIAVIGYVNPVLLIPAVLLGVIFYKLRNYYLGLARQIKRLEGIGKLSNGKPI